MLLESTRAKLGWQAPNFVLQDPQGQAFELRQQLGDKGLVIAFICNHCPYVQALVGRLVEAAQQLQALGVNVLALMSNDYHTYQQDSPENMQRFAAQHNFSFPYLVDHDQQVARAYGAVCTPEFYGLNALGELQYRGRLDDAGMTNNKQRKQELLEAMELIAATGQGPEQQWPSLGCSLKWRR